MPCHPGFLRVDTVHQGDRDGAKGVYLVNLVDQITQYEFVGAIEAISERFLAPLLEALLGLFPFAVVGFHADNGSEYINHTVAALLNKPHIRDFTKSRPRRSTTAFPCLVRRRRPAIRPRRGLRDFAFR